MSSSTNTEQQSVRPNAETDLWLICPICRQPNPAGTLHCKYCWGASLYSVVPINNEQLEAYVHQRDIHQSRFRLIRNLIIGIGAPSLLIMAGLFWIYTFTDLMFAPPEYLNSASTDDNWTMYRHDPERTGAIDITATNPSGELKWSFKTGNEISSSPVVVNGIVYFGSTDFKFYAVDADTGEKLWDFTAGSFVESSPAVSNGIVYFGSNDGRLYALDALTGKKIWDFQTKYPIKSSPAIANNTVYFGADDYCIYAVDATTGAKKWSFETGSHVMSSPVIANGILYVGTMDNACYALNAENGRFRLKMRTREEVVGSPIVSGDTVYFIGGRYLYAMDGKARNWPLEEDFRPWWLQFWAFGIAPPPPPVSGVLWSTMLSPTSSNTTPVLDGEVVYTTGDSRILKLDLTTKKPLWEYKTGGTIRSSPALANGVVYVGSNDGKLYAVNAQDGTPLWDFTTGGQITSAPTYANGVVYVTSRDGSLYAIK
jgi:outer membrane protein assembly factor BamB